MNIRNPAVALCLAALLLGPGPAPGAEGVPRSISYQGLLTDAETGQPLTGTLDITVSLYSPVDAPVGSALWSETHTAVEVNNGLFNVTLGSVDPVGNPLNLAFDTQYALGIIVGADGEMLPRRLLTSVGYAVSADFAQTAGTSASAADVTGTVAVANGGTGATEAVGALNNLGAAPVAHAHDYRYFTESESDVRFVQAAGDTMGGTLDMGGNPLTNVGGPGTDFSAAGGLTLSDRLVVSANGAEIEGDVRLGAGAALQAVAAEERLAIVRGRVLGTNGDILSGSGFSVLKTGTGLFTVTFTTPFAGEPVVTGTANSTLAETVTVVSPAAGSVQIRTHSVSGLPYDTTFMFIAVGPR